MCNVSPQRTLWKIYVLLCALFLTDIFCCFFERKWFFYFYIQQWLYLFYVSSSTSFPPVELCSLHTRTQNTFYVLHFTFFSFWPKVKLNKKKISFCLGDDFDSFFLPPLWRWWEKWVREEHINSHLNCSISVQSKHHAMLLSFFDTDLALTSWESRISPPSIF